MTVVRFTQPQATPDGLRVAGEIVDVPEHLARKYIDFGRAELVAAPPRRRGRPPKKEQAAPPRRRGRPPKKEQADLRRGRTVETR